MLDFCDKKVLHLQNKNRKIQSTVDVERLEPHYKIQKDNSQSTSVNYIEPIINSPNANNNNDHYYNDQIKSEISNELGNLERLLYARKKLSQDIKDDTEKEKYLELEKLNFQMWLLKKKRQELETKKKQRMIKEEKELQSLEKEKRNLENQLRYQLWLKRKEEEVLQRKINEHQEKIKILEEKNRRLEESKRAYNEWLEHSKNRQKPVPSNQGLTSLCAKTSVSYINPKPWQFE